MDELRVPYVAMEAPALLELPDLPAGSPQLALAASVFGYLFYCLRRDESSTLPSYNGRVTFVLEWSPQFENNVYAFILFMT